MLSCKQVTELLSKAEVSSLSFFEKISLKMHLMMCKVCKQFSLQMIFLKKVFKLLPGKIQTVEELSPEVKSKIKQELLK
jgi:hypothetical protein